jgi:hypothetical protein
VKLRSEAAWFGQAIAAILIVSLGRAGGNELSLTVCQDALFRPGAGDSTVHPVAVLAGLGLKFGTSGSLDLRAGYSGYSNHVGSLSVIDSRTAFNGARLQIAPVYRVMTPIKDASVFGGVGLAARFAMLRRGHWMGATIFNWRDVLAFGADQTFIAGLGYEPSRRFGADLTLERVGFSLAQDVERTYYRSDYPEKDSVELTGYQKTLDVGWRAAAPIGVGVGLRLKL